MAVYVASFFEPQHYHGQLFSIASETPKGFKRISRLEFLVPASVAWTAGHSQPWNEEHYVQQYRQLLGSRWQTVKQWLRTLEPQQDITLLCWERQGEFCHRDLVAQLIQKHRPDCWGGCDVRRLAMPRCPVCGSPCIPGLDANFCSCCQLWKSVTEGDAV